MHVLSKAEVDAHRARSRTPASGPWASDYIPMGRKTVIRVMAPFLPLTVETAHAIAADGRVHQDTVPDLDALASVLDVAVEPPPSEDSGDVTAATASPPEESLSGTTVARASA